MKAVVAGCVILIQTLLLDAADSFRSFTAVNRVLPGQGFRAIRASDWLVCFRACQEEPRCVSYNYQLVSSDTKACQLNAHGVNECCEEESLVFVEGFVFHQLKPFQAKRKCSKDKGSALSKKAYKNCHEVLHYRNVSGIYAIDPDNQGAFNVYCDQTTSGGGWTVFQRRQGGLVDFYRGRNEYKNGFGNLTGEFWLGFDNIHRLTSKAVTSELRIEVEEFGGNTAFATYMDFKVADDFVIKFGNYSGTAGDSLTWHEGMPFTTADVDNGDCDYSCSQMFHGAWWYVDETLRSNLNGRYYDSAVSEVDGIVWLDWQGFNVSLKATEMKVRVMHD